jgi:putative tricarboxylic transport membrane protein
MVGIPFLVLSCLVMVESVRLKLDSIHNPGPGFMPFFLGLALAILSILSLFFTKEQDDVAALWKDWKRRKSTFYIVAGLVIYLLLLKTLGFYIDTLLLMFFLFKLSGEKGYRRPVLISLLTLGITYLLFYKLLFIPFPRGLLGI